MCLVIDDPQYNSISSMVEANWLTQAENGVSRKYSSKTRRSFVPAFKIKPCGTICKFGKNLSSQHVNSVSHLLHSSLFRVVSNLVKFLDTEMWLPQARACLRCSVVMGSMDFVDCDGGGIV